MSKGRKRKAIPPPQGQWQEQSTTKKLISWIVAWTLAGIAIVGFFAAFWPRVNVESDASFDPSHPSPMTFTIINGLLPLANVHPSVGICEIWTGHPKIIQDSCDGHLGTHFSFSQWNSKWLGMDEKQTIRINDVLNPGRIGAASISIIISYEPLGIPYRMEKEFRFTTRPEENGKMSWIRRPLFK